MKIPRELAFLGSLAFEIMIFVVGSAFFGQFLVKTYQLNPIITPILVFLGLTIVIYRVYEWNKRNQSDG